MRTARKASGLTVGALAKELTALGWRTSGAELGEIETGKRIETPGTAVPLLSAVLGLDAATLVQADNDAIDWVFELQRVRAAVAEAAGRLGRSFDDIAATLRPRLAGAQFRERDSSEDDVAEIVESLLASLDER